MYLEKDEMKFAILYTLEKNVEPMSMSLLCEVLTWDKNVMGYFELAEMLAELIEDNYAERVNYRGEEAFRLTGKGKDTNEFFSRRVPASIRDRINDAVSGMKYETQTNPNAVVCEILPAASGRYMASMQILDLGSPIMELRLETGGRVDAERMIASMKKKAEEIYAQTLKILDE